ncbi:MAG: neprosin family prolyl endopeptidase [Gammaproteobacteria bacterium]|nr:neprosin family prolyl endopeptidase [Gammaproteobacteria bacterium]
MQYVINSTRLRKLCISALLSSGLFSQATFAAVASDTELKRMQSHIDSLYQNVKSVHQFVGVEGESVMCVDLFAQPAFNHPGLRDHKLQLQPSQELKDRMGSTDTKDATIAYSGELKGDVDALGNLRYCPDGSVPIKQLTLDEMSRFPSLEAFLGKYPEGKIPDDDDRLKAAISGSDIIVPADNTGPSSLHQYAYIRDYVDSWGAETVFNVWSPYVERSNEFSLSQMWVVRGSGGDRETIESGWQVYKDKYGDNRARLFLYFTPDNYGSGGCYNLDCSGFVQVAGNIYIGGGFSNYSVYNGAQYTFKLLWVRDPANGNWWLKYGNTWVGYYPTGLFDSNGLKNKANKLSYGGEIIDRQTSGRHTKTDMGSGSFPSAGFSRAAYQRSIRYVDTSYYYRTHTGLFEARDDSQCYDVDMTSSTGSWGTYFYFGGAGYHSTNCK